VNANVVGTRDQSPERATTPRLGWDAKHGLWKAAPLVDWTERTMAPSRGVPTSVTSCPRAASGKDVAVPIMPAPTIAIRTGHPYHGPEEPPGGEPR